MIGASHNSKLPHFETLKNSTLLKKMLKQAKNAGKPVGIFFERPAPSNINGGCSWISYTT